jgi:hypothetical protein
MLTLFGGDNHLVFPSAHKNWKFCKGTFSVQSGQQQVSSFREQIFINLPRHIRWSFWISDRQKKSFWKDQRKYHVTIPSHIAVFETSANQKAILTNQLCWILYQTKIMWENTKAIIRWRISKRMIDKTLAKRKRKDNNDRANTTQKTKDWATRTPLKAVSELGCFLEVSSSCSRSVILALLLNDTRISWYGNGVGHQYAWIVVHKWSLSPLQSKSDQSRTEHRFMLELKGTTQHGTLN